MLFFLVWRGVRHLLLTKRELLPKQILQKCSFGKLDLLEMLSILILPCRFRLWFAFLLLGESSYELIKLFLNSIFGKFIAIGITWSFSFHILSEIRHLIMDLGYGFEIKTSNLTGMIVIIFSFILTILIYLLGRQ